MVLRQEIQLELSITLMKKPASQDLFIKMKNYQILFSLKNMMKYFMKKNQMKVMAQGMY